MSDASLRAYSLAELGWQGVFRQQLTPEELDRLQPLRLIEKSRQEMTLIGEQGCCTWLCCPLCRRWLLGIGCW